MRGPSPTLPASSPGPHANDPVTLEIQPREGKKEREQRFTGGAFRNDRRYDLRVCMALEFTCGNLTPDATVFGGSASGK